MRIALSPGQAEPQAVERVPLAIGEPLSPEEIERILARLPVLAVDPGDQVELRLPEDILPPPRPGVPWPWRPALQRRMRHGGSWLCSRRTRRR